MPAMSPNENAALTAVLSGIDEMFKRVGAFNFTLSLRDLRWFARRAVAGSGDALQSPASVKRVVAALRDGGYVKAVETDRSGRVTSWTRA